MEELKAYIPQLLAVGQGVLLCVAILVIGWIASKWGERLLSRALIARDFDRAVTRFLSGLVRYALLIASIIGALEAVGIETTSFVAILGSAGIAIGLALQGNLSHLASGVTILFFRPFQLDDVITAAGHTGTVVDIGLFATTLHTPSNERIIIPNGAISSAPIINMTALGTRRATVNVGVAYGEDVEQVRQILLEAASSCPLVLDEPAPAVAFTALSASSIDFAVHCWVNASDFVPVSDQLRAACYSHLNARGVEIPFNQIVVHQAPPAEARA